MRYRRQSQLVANNLSTMKDSAASTAVAIISKYSHSHERGFGRSKRFHSNQNNDKSGINISVNNYSNDESKVSSNSKELSQEDSPIKGNQSYDKQSKDLKSMDIASPAIESKHKISSLQGVFKPIADEIDTKSPGTKQASHDLQIPSQHPAVVISYRDILRKHVLEDTSSSSDAMDSDVVSLKSESLPWYIYDILKIPSKTVQKLDAEELAVLFKEIRSAYHIIHNQNQRVSDKIHEIDLILSLISSRNIPRTMDEQF